MRGLGGKRGLLPGALLVKWAFEARLESLLGVSGHQTPSRRGGPPCRLAAGLPQQCHHWLPWSLLSAACSWRTRGYDTLLRSPLRLVLRPAGGTPQEQSRCATQALHNAPVKMTTCGKRLPVMGWLSTPRFSHRSFHAPTIRFTKLAPFSRITICQGPVCRGGVTIAHRVSPTALSPRTALDILSLPR